MCNQVTIYMYTRAVKANKAGLHPIYVRITIQGKRTEFSTKENKQKSVSILMLDFRYFINLKYINSLNRFNKTTYALRQFLSYLLTFQA